MNEFEDKYFFSKVNARNIFKHTVARPINKPSNKQIAMLSTSLKPSSSTSSLKDLDKDKLSLSFKLDNYLKVQVRQKASSKSSRLIALIFSGQ